MRVMVQSVLPNCVEAIWNEVQTSRLLVEVASPLVAIRPVKHESLPARWIAGTTVRIRSYLFGIIPLGTRALHFESVDDTTHEIQTRESDPLIRRWDHLISVQPAADGRCRYRDQIEI